MKVGDYVRTKNKPFQPSQIAKIKNIEKDMVYKRQKCLNLDHNLLTNYAFLIYKEDIIKSSPNIIDLIEVGDYVNGFEVLRIDDECNLYPKTLKCQYTNNTDYFDIFNENIRGVLTKEQFKSMEYKVKE